MRVIGSLLGYALTYWALLLALPIWNSVPHSSWIGLFVLGALATAALQLQTRWIFSARSWALFACYCLLLSSLFFGANFALDALGTSVKPRAELPTFVAGLELYHVLVPGAFSAAVGAFLAACMRPYRRRIRHSARPDTT